MKLALIQMTTGFKDSLDSLTSAIEKIKEAAFQGADLVILPEMFNCPYDTAAFPLYAQEEGGFNWQALSEIAKKEGIYLVAGSIPELVREKGKPDKVYNTSFVFDRNGRQLARHRKMHLFDVAIEGGQHFKESDTLTAGDEVTVFQTEFGPVGLLICFDIRFPEMVRQMRKQGCKLVTVPAAFNMTSGPLWWDLVFRARAVDNQLFMAGCAPARNAEASYIAWGHSLVVDPWGKITGQLDEKEGILYQEIALSLADDVRKQVPLKLEEDI
ncbi:MAG: carbon-nitrogen hydrolase family protein [Treponemataceae bacterium]|nr:carbon-nitrogen hydrolase family protein [Treponemataceae bacterium]